MSLSVGIVGLPNVGKSTLFNALLKKQSAYVANFPFATIDPNLGVVFVPDERLDELSRVVKESESLDFFPPKVYSTCEFVDIAGLIEGAHKGEGLGNKFLSHIRETNAICHVLRDFGDSDIVREGSKDPASDFKTIELELMLADLSTLEKQKDPGGSPDKEMQKKWAVVKKLREALEKEIPAREVELSVEDEKYAKELSLLTQKPILVAVNSDEEALKNASSLEEKYAGALSVNKDQVVVISAKIESEISGLSQEDQREYLKDLGVDKSGLERLIKKAFSTLGLISFLTAGEKEVRSWTVKDGMNAKEASGVIHTDFMDKFIKADVCGFNDFINALGWKNARDKGLVKSEGKDYLVKEGDVIEFKIGT